jgi:hypothetical protein
MYLSAVILGCGRTAAPPTNSVWKDANGNTVLEVRQDSDRLEIRMPPSTSNALSGEVHSGEVRDGVLHFVLRLEFKNPGHPLQGHEYDVSLPLDKSPSTMTATHKQSGMVVPRELHRADPS